MRERREVTICGTDGTRNVIAEMHGDYLCIHHAMPTEVQRSGPYWRLTHEPTGLAIGPVMKKAQCVRLAEKLMDFNWNWNRVGCSSHKKLSPEVSRIVKEHVREFDPYYSGDAA